MPCPGYRWCVWAGARVHGAGLSSCWLALGTVAPVSPTHPQLLPPQVESEGPPGTSRCLRRIEGSKAVGAARARQAFFLCPQGLMMERLSHRGGEGRALAAEASHEVRERWEPEAGLGLRH